MWANFDRNAYTREEFAAHVESLKWTTWRPKAICLHNTAAPTLKQWAETGPNHDARITNLQHYYEGMGWHAGPHLFISRGFINGFSNLLQPGVHSRCFNSTHIGIEMVGDYAVEPFDSGDGAMVRDNAVFAMAHLFKAIGVSPTTLVFHRECVQDHHDCPGRLVDKTDMIRRVTELMATLGVDAPPAKPQIVKSPDGTLNLRSNAGADSLITGILKNGDAVEIIDRNAAATWGYVRASDGRTGWVNVRYLA